MDYTSKENNNFNLIRLIAAYMVILAHSFAIQDKGDHISVSDSTFIKEYLFAIRERG